MLKTIFLMLLAAAAATVIPFQAIVNGRLGQAVANPFLAALISFLGGTLALSAVTLIWSGGFPRFHFVNEIPWYLYTGGLMGAVFVTAVLVLVPQIGAANVLAAALVGQMLMSLMVDHWGLLGIPREPVSLVKIAGVVLLFAGTWLIQRG